ncbi:MAG: FAD-binding oxidoreductase [Alphaproteobacteria bacterium]|nr:FAD-binding oxidoreductase [Alphaproteobacteria bacterium]
MAHPLLPPQGYYAASAPPALERPRFQGKAEVELCVIGGGFTGLSAALHLAEAGATPILLEAQDIGYGASGRNGGQIHAGLRQDQASLEAMLGRNHARELWQLSEDAKALVRSLARKVGCSVQDGLIKAAHSPRALAHLHSSHDYLEDHYGYTATRMLDAGATAAAIGSTLYCGASLDRSGGHLHPLSLARGLAQAAEAAGAKLYVRSKVECLEAQADSVRILCADAELRARRVIVACDAWAGSILPTLAPFMAPVESFLIATEPLPAALSAQILPGNEAVADTRHVLDYYRKSADQRLLFAGREAYVHQPKDIAALVRPRMLTVFPQLRDCRIDYAWSGTVAVTRSRLPQFGRMGSRILFGHGYSGQGVALSVMGGRLMAEAALGPSPGFEALASIPARPFPGGPLLRKPLVVAALQALRWLDALG